MTVEPDRTGICAHPECDSEFTRPPKAWRQRYCRPACRIDDWYRLNPRPKALNKVYNRTRYLKHRDKILAYKALRTKTLCECGRGRRQLQASGIRQCDECEGIPAPSEFLDTRGGLRVKREAQ